MTRRDPGLQPERTRLAWRRTALGATGISLLAARLALVEGAPLGLLAAVALWLAVLVVGQRRVTALAPARPAAAGRSLPALALIVVGYAVLGLLLVVG
jgi:hypothetical protein